MIEPEHLNRLQTQEEFDRFLADLDDESDRGVILSACCMLELQIKRCVEALLSQGPKEAMGRLTRNDGPLGSFSSRLDLLCCMGGIDEFEHKALHVVRRLRNDFAHNLIVDLSTPSIADRCMEFCNHVLQELEPATLKKLIKRGPRPSFTAAVFVLADILKLRPFLISSMSASIKHDFAGMNREVERLFDTIEESK